MASVVAEEAEERQPEQRLLGYVAVSGEIARFLYCRGHHLDIHWAVETELFRVFIHAQRHQPPSWPNLEVRAQPGRSVKELKVRSLQWKSVGQLIHDSKTHTRIGDC